MECDYDSESAIVYDGSPLTDSIFDSVTLDDYNSVLQSVGRERKRLLFLLIVACEDGDFERAGDLRRRIDELARVSRILDDIRGYFNCGDSNAD
ncbi:hypothetical protein [Methanolobus sp. WCC4]|uniref:hypothetical protein n=1 Tax=Methanolobus sp. WCC4 TaxID=3125784 RepID=UPI0030FD16ED